MNGIQKVSGSIPLISTTHLIHHICSMWFFLFTLLTAISDSLDSMRHFIPLESVPYFAAASSHCFISMFRFLLFTDISDSLDFMRRFAPLKSVPYLIFGPAYQCRNVKGTILYLYDSIVPFYFPWYRPKSLF